MKESERLRKVAVGCNGVTNRGGCASSQSSGSPLILGNQKLPKEAPV